MVEKIDLKTLKELIFNFKILYLVPVSKFLATLLLAEHLISFSLGLTSDWLIREDAYEHTLFSFHHVWNYSIYGTHTFYIKKTWYAG